MITRLGGVSSLSVRGLLDSTGMSDRPETLPADPGPARTGPAPGEIARRVLAAKRPAAKESAQVTAPPAERSAEVEALLDGLNPAQRAAVEHSGGPLLIVAGAGSGKTRVLTRRIAYLIKARGVRPSQILAITFTNKAAGEMKERVAEAVGLRPRRTGSPRSTPRACGSCGMTPSGSGSPRRSRSTTTPIAAADADGHPRHEAGPEAVHPARDRQRDQRPKDELIDHETYAANAEGPIQTTYAECYTEYQRRLRAANALDFDDLIMTTVNLLQAFPDVAEHYRRRFRHVLVDEYQDTNHAQYVLVRELVGVTGEIEGPGARRAVRGRRRGPVDLRLPRRDHPQHRRVRGRTTPTPR